MRKRILTLLLCAAMLFGMVPNVVAAEAPAAIGTEPAEEEVYSAPGRVRVPVEETSTALYQPTVVSSPKITLEWESGTSEWANDNWSATLPNGVTYASDTHTLTLNGATLSSLGLENFGDTTVTVQVVGNNTIASSTETGKSQLRHLYWWRESLHYQSIQWWADGFR